MHRVLHKVWRMALGCLWLPVVTVAAAPPPATPSTYYVRSDGGSASQCSGKADAPWRGAGSGSACAWKNPMIALPPGAPARLAGGDTLIIDAGSYMLGFGAPGAEACSVDWPWDCVLAPLPSGPDAARPTRLLGKGHDGACAAPPRLWGTQRAASVLSLVGTRHAQVDCLELTDRSACAEFHSGGLKCERDRFPYGEWASVGIVARDSADVRLSRLNIHGLASTGVQAGRLSDWTLEKVRIAANGWVGWNGDIGAKTSGNTGKITFREVDIEWNGCPESVPDRRPAGCWAQSAGGYGDGLGTAETGGVWLFEDTRFRFNTSDGLDLLYHTAAGSVTLRRVWAEGNAGNQLKVAGNAVIENSVVIANCGFFNGKPFSHAVDDCRASGDAVALVTQAAGQLQTFVNNTVISEGNTVLLFSGVKGSQLIAQNNILIGRPSFLSPGKQSADLYAAPPTPGEGLSDRFNLKVGLRNDACRGEGTLCKRAGERVLRNETFGQIDPRPLAGSAAVARGLPVGWIAPADDLYRRPRPRTGPATLGAVGAEGSVGSRGTPESRDSLRRGP